MTVAVALHGLERRFGDRVAVDGVSFEVGAGEVFGLLGPNGAGKTTVIRLLCGLLAPTAGTGSVLGFDIGRERLRIREHVGYMSQGFGLYRELTVDENLRFFADMYGAGQPGAIEEIRQRLDLDGVRHAVVEGLPTGVRQRVALGAALVHHPDLLFLDEPTSVVDPMARNDMWQLVRHLASEGITVMVTTHVMPEAERCDRLVLLAAGRVVTIGGTAAEIVDRSGITIARVDARPWKEALARLKVRWPDAALHGRRVHVPVSGHGAEEPELRQALQGIELRSLTWQPPTMEDAFIGLVGNGE